jgi:hypothetical protein
VLLHNALDASVTAKATTVYSLLALLGAGFFQILQDIAADVLSDAVRLPLFAGWIATCAIALAVLPLRRPVQRLFRQRHGIGEGPRTIMRFSYVGPNPLAEKPFQHAVRRGVPAHGGTVIDLTESSALVAFPDAARAYAARATIQTGFETACDALGIPPTSMACQLQDENAVASENRSPSDLVPGN